MSKKSWGTCVNLLNEKGLVDVYNDLTSEEEGKEKRPTFFLTRHLDKPFHFDRCVAAKNRVKNLIFLLIISGLVEVIIYLLLWNYRED